MPRHLRPRRRGRAAGAGIDAFPAAPERLETRRPRGRFHVRLRCAGSRGRARLRGRAGRVRPGGAVGLPRPRAAAAPRARAGAA